MQWIKCVCNVFPVACQFPARVTICWYRFLINKLYDPTLLHALVCLLLLIRGYCQSFVMCAESCSQDFMSWHCCLLHGMISRKRRRGKGDVVRIRSVVHSNTQLYTNTHSHTYIQTNSHICTHIQTCTCESLWATETTIVSWGTRVCVCLCHVSACFCLILWLIFSVSSNSVPFSFTKVI